MGFNLGFKGLNQQQTHIKLLKCENQSSFTEIVMKNNSMKREGK